MTREERIASALATVENDKDHCPKCKEKYSRFIGADGGVWYSCKKCGIVECPGIDTHSKRICDKASFDLRDEVLALRARVAEWERIKALYRNEWAARKESCYKQNQYHGHGHSIDGVWDGDNGPLLGCECAACAMHNAALSQLSGEKVVEG